MQHASFLGSSGGRIPRLLTGCLHLMPEQNVLTNNMVLTATDTNYLFPIKLDAVYDILDMDENMVRVGV